MMVKNQKERNKRKIQTSEAFVLRKPSGALIAQGTIPLIIALATSRDIAPCSAGEAIQGTNG
jgi:hypothetical protein